MKQGGLKLASVILGIAIVGMLWIASRRGSDGSTSYSASDNVTASVVAAGTTAAVSDLSLGSFGKQPTEEVGSAAIAGDASDGPVLTLGVIGATPSRKNITTIEKLPFTQEQIRRDYRSARDRACRLSIPGAAVDPPKPRSAGGKYGSYGRLPAMSLGLNLSGTAGSKLPTVVRAQVQKYFERHRMSIQPMVYHDDQGRLYFGTDCLAAFYERDRPTITVAPESMIESAVGRFRALGVAAAPEDQLGRTLAMAFTFEARDPRTITSSGSKQAMEMLLLHLPEDASMDRPTVQVFITSDDRQTLHRLRTVDGDLTTPMPTISSDVQFEGTSMMGMYPANPVVTGINYRSEGIVAMEAIRRLANEEGSTLSITEILDRFGSLSSAE